MNKFRNAYGIPNEKTKPYSYPIAYDHVLHFNSEIDAPEYYAEFADTLIAASENDTVSIYFATGGGRDDTMIVIMNLIRNCKARVIGYLIADASSAGSFILLNCDEIYVGDHVDMLVHAGSYGSVGDYATVKAHTEHNWKKTKKLLEETYKYFLTDEEINDVLVNNRQMFLDSEEINRRLIIRAEGFEKEHQQAITEQQSSLEQVYAELDSLSEMLPDEVIDKLSKQQLRDYIKGTIEVKVNEDGSYEIVEVEEIEE